MDENTKAAKNRQAVKKCMSNKDRIELGVIYINNGEKCLLDNLDDAFNTIPERVNCITYELDEETKNKKLEINKKIEEYHKWLAEQK